jgi:hypothetical protein
MAEKLEIYKCELILKVIPPGVRSDETDGPTRKSSLAEVELMLNPERQLPDVRDAFKRRNQSQKRIAKEIIDEAIDGKRDAVQKNGCPTLFHGDFQIPDLHYTFER